MSLEVGITMKFTTNYTGQDVEISRDSYGEIVLKIDDTEFEVDSDDLDTLIKTLIFFQSGRDKTVLDTVLNIADDKHVAFP